MNIVFLPATEPASSQYGSIPSVIDGFPDASVYKVRYPNLVWYNKPVQEEAISQIMAMGISPIVLVGFSKSGLGAWNITRSIPELIAATIIFDAPVARKELPPWGTAPFYPDDASWRQDLPMLSACDFADRMPESHQLVLISGPGFQGEMQSLSEALLRIGHVHTFLDRPNMPHDWNSGWITEAIQVLRLSE